MKTLHIFLALPILMATVQPARVIAADGKALFATCQGCHGARGEGNSTMNAPALSQLDATYLKRQLGNFRSGVRGSDAKDTAGAQMRAMAATLKDDTAIDAVVAYITTLPREKPAATISGDTGNGRDYYSMVCGGCHGPAAEGNAALNAPRLAGTDDWYLARQFENFRSGLRGSHPDDRFGAQMRAMTKALPNEKAVHDVVAYINTLKP